MKFMKLAAGQSSNLKYLAILVILIGSNAVWAGISDGLVGHWSFDSCNAQDGSGNNNGTVYGDPICVDGKVGKAFRFNGSTNYIKIPSSSTFPSDAITVSFWINREGLSVNGLFENVISKELSFQNYIARNYCANCISSGLWKGSPGIWSGYDTPANALKTSGWNHFAFTFDNATKTAHSYVNGVLVHSEKDDDENARVRTSVYDLYIGRNGSADVYYMAGLLDEVRIYKRALSNSEIQQLVGSVLTLTVATTGNGQGVVSSEPADIACGSTCVTNLVNDTNVTLHATPSAGSTFTGWSGDCSGVSSCTISMTSNKKVTANFSSVGAIPVVNLSTTTLSFVSHQAQATASLVQNVTLTNTGAASLNINAISVTGDFSQTTTCGTTLAAGDNCAISVIFLPMATGGRSGMLTISSNASGSPHAISLNGTGTEKAEPWVSLSSNNLTYVGKNATRVPQSVVLTNIGQALLNISGIAVSGDFSKTTTCGTTLAAGANCTISVMFPQTAVGASSGMLTISSNASGSPHSISLRGIGAIKGSAISAGSAGFHTAAVKSDGSLWTWGYNGYYQLGTNTIASWHNTPLQVGSGFSSVATGFLHTVALKTDGSLWSWGANGAGYLGLGTSTDYSSNPMLVGTNFSAVAVGGVHTVALKNDGGMWAWGDNMLGQLGDGTVERRYSPVQVGSGFSAVAAGWNYTMALKADGGLWAWGLNTYGQLGDGSTIDRHAPVKIGSGFSAIAAGGYHAIALKADGSLWAWGYNFFGQLGDGTTMDRHTPVLIGSDFISVAAGELHTLAIKSDGSLWAWGQNTYGQLGNGTSTHSYVPVLIGHGFNDVAAGDRHSAAMKSDGTLWAWGDNRYGQLGDGTLARRFTPVLVVNDTLEGYFVLINENSVAFPSDKTPAFLLRMSKTNTFVNATLKYDVSSSNKSGNVYVVALLNANSRLLSKGGNFAVASDAVVPAVLTRGGWKQMGGQVTEPVYGGNLDNNNNTFSLYSPPDFDQEKDYGVFCVGYATDVGTPSAKGQIRAAVTGKIDGAYQCPPLQVAGAAAFTATSNDRTEALTINAAIAPKSADISKPMNVYTWAVTPNGSFFVKKPGGWYVMNALQLDTNFSATLTNNLAVPIVDNLDLRSLVGTQAYVGYGTSEKEMLDNARYGLVYTIK